VRHRDGRLEEVALDLIVPGDRLLVRQGDVVPVDGSVVEGVAVLDQSALTGESLPVQLRPGDAVLSGSTNVGDAFDLTAERPAAQSTYAGVIRLVGPPSARAPRCRGWPTATRSSSWR
jgi:P-type E1-E2 ATPase